MRKRNGGGGGGAGGSNNRVQYVDLTQLLNACMDSSYLSLSVDTRMCLPHGLNEMSIAVNDTQSSPLAFMLMVRCVSVSSVMRCSRWSSRTVSASSASVDGITGGVNAADVTWPQHNTFFTHV